MIRKVFIPNLGQGSRYGMGAFSAIATYVATKLSGKGAEKYVGWNLEDILVDLGFSEDFAEFCANAMDVADLISNPFAFIAEACAKYAWQNPGVNPMAGMQYNGIGSGKTKYGKGWKTDGAKWLGKAVLGNEAYEKAANYISETFPALAGILDFAGYFDIISVAQLPFERAKTLNDRIASGEITPEQAVEEAKALQGEGSGKTKYGKGSRGVNVNIHNLSDWSANGIGKISADITKAGMRELRHSRTGHKKGRMFIAYPEINDPSAYIDQINQIVSSVGANAEIEKVSIRSADGTMTYSIPYDKFMALSKTQESFDEWYRNNSGFNPNMGDKPTAPETKPQQGKPSAQQEMLQERVKQVQERANIAEDKKPIEKPQDIPEKPIPKPESAKSKVEEEPTKKEEIHVPTRDEKIRTNPFKEESKKVDWKANAFIEDSMKRDTKVGDITQAKIDTFKGGEYFNDASKASPTARLYIKGAATLDEVAKAVGFNGIPTDDTVLNQATQQALGYREFGLNRTWAHFVVDAELWKKGGMLPIDRWTTGGVDPFEEDKTKENVKQPNNKIEGEVEDAVKLKEKGLAPEVAPNGKHYEEKEILALMDKGETRESAIATLSKMDKYCKKEEKKNKNPIDAFNNLLKKIQDEVNNLFRGFGVETGAVKNENELDELGNIKAYKGPKEALITKDDNDEVKKKKLETQKKWIEENKKDTKPTIDANKLPDYTVGGGFTGDLKKNKQVNQLEELEKLKKEQPEKKDNIPTIIRQQEEDRTKVKDIEKEDKLEDIKKQNEETITQMDTVNQTQLKNAKDNIDSPPTGAVSQEEAVSLLREGVNYLKIIANALTGGNLNNTVNNTVNVRGGNNISMIANNRSARDGGDETANMEALQAMAAALFNVTSR